MGTLTTVHKKTTSEVYSRGNPDRPSLDGKEQEKVHLHQPARIKGVTKDYPLCHNGAFNLRWTDNRNKVTCPACLEKMGLELIAVIIVNFSPHPNGGLAAHGEHFREGMIRPEACRFNDEFEAIEFILQGMEAQGVRAYHSACPSAVNWIRA